jgi:hypothetical protein
VRFACSTDDIRRSFDARAARGKQELAIVLVVPARERGSRSDTWLSVSAL